jgi:hypothetical protein
MEPLARAVRKSVGLKIESRELIPCPAFVNPRRRTPGYRKMTGDPEVKRILADLSYRE